MTKEEKQSLAEAALPLEVLCTLINIKPYKEITTDLQEKLLRSLAIIRELLFNEKT